MENGTSRIPVAHVMIVVLVPLILWTLVYLSLETFVLSQESMYLHWPFNMTLGGLLLPLMCVIPGLAVLVKRWGWRVGLLIAIIYVPLMTSALLVFAVILDGGI